MVVFKKAKAILLCDSPYLTNKLLKKLAREEEVNRLMVKRENVKAIAIVLHHGDVFIVSITITLFKYIVGQLMMPIKLASGKKEDIVQGWIHGVGVRDTL